MLLALAQANQVHSFGAMSIDLGSEWMKVGVVAPGLAMDIALSIEGERTVPMAVAMSNGKVTTGYQALKTASKYPDKAFTHFLNLAGKSIDHEAVLHYKKQFPHANITASSPSSDDDNSTASIVLNHPDGLTTTPLELISIMLKHALNQVRAASNGESINDVVITIPPFFELSERKVIRLAAKDAGLKVLKLIHTNSAFALSYGVFRHTDYAKNSTVLFFDQGASSTSVTIADYYLSNNDTLPTVNITHEFYDAQLGGFDMELRLRDYLLDEFVEQTAIEKDRVINRTRSFYKLLLEAKKVKKVLSANTKHNARIESVIDNLDLFVPVTREKYEELCADLFARIDILLSKAAEVINPELIIIVGGNTRTPKIKQILEERFGQSKVGKFINADEGAALAALYQAASLIPGFKTKEYLLNENLGEEDPAEFPPVDDIIQDLLKPFKDLSKIIPNPADILNSSFFGNSTFDVNTTTIENLTTENITIPHIESNHSTTIEAPVVENPTLETSTISDNTSLPPQSTQTTETPRIEL